MLLIVELQYYTFAFAITIIRGQLYVQARKHVISTLPSCSRDTQSTFAASLGARFSNHALSIASPRMSALYLAKRGTPQPTRNVPRLNYSVKAMEIPRDLSPAA